MSSKTDDLLIIFVRADGAMGGLEHSARLCIETEIIFLYAKSLHVLHYQNMYEVESRACYKNNSRFQHLERMEFVFGIRGCASK